ncbi:MAG: helix-turn-helix domain-containing protein [Cyclobacteriaceae bacterium]
MNYQLLEEINPTQIIENRKVFSGDHSELCLYETFTDAERIHFGHLQNPVLLFMLNGKKIIHDHNENQHKVFDFKPGESLIMAPVEEVEIDFPDACPDDPTRCLTLEIAGNIIANTLSQFHEGLPAESKDDVMQDTSLKYESINDARINNAIHRLCTYYTQEFDPTSRKLLINHTLQELVVLIMQTKAGHILRQKKSNELPRLQYVIDYIMNHINEDLSVDLLSEKACMSKSTFFRYFKKMLGLSPVDFVNKKRMQIARKMLSQGDSAVTDVCFAVGYNNTSHFIRSFKKFYGCTPKQYQKHNFQS